MVQNEVWGIEPVTFARFRDYRTDRAKTKLDWYRQPLVSLAGDDPLAAIESGNDEVSLIRLGGLQLLIRLTVASPIPGFLVQMYGTKIIPHTVTTIAECVRKREDIVDQVIGDLENLGILRKTSWPIPKSDLDEYRIALENSRRKKTPNSEFVPTPKLDELLKVICGAPFARLKPLNQQKIETSIQSHTIDVVMEALRNAAKVTRDRPSLFDILTRIPFDRARIQKKKADEPQRTCEFLPQ